MMSKEIDSQYFKRREFACKCGCGFDVVDQVLLELLEAVRMKFEQPVYITSGCRCVKHNKAVGGAANSKHTFGIAADFKVEGVMPSTVYKYLDEALGDSGGLGIYKSWIHLDVRSDKARWKG